MTKLDLKKIILECLTESDIPVGGLVGKIPVDVMKSRMVPSQPSKAIKLAGFKKDEPDPELQSELDDLARRYEPNLIIKLFGYTDSIKLQGLNASKDAPKGTGSSFMRDLTRLADEKGLMITLTPAVKGYGDTGFKKTSSYQRLVDFYKRFGFKNKYGKTSYRPELSDTMFREPKLNEINSKVSDYKYYGFTPKQEDEIHDKIVHYHKTKNPLEKQKIEQEFETLYQYIVGRNPVLKDINVYIRDYDKQKTPRMDLVFGAISGIPPEDIKNYIEVTKGLGGMNVPSGYEIDPSAKRFIKLKRKDDDTLAAIN